MYDGKRHTLIGWIREQYFDEYLLKAGWVGALSLPRSLEIVDNKLKIYPVKELEKLRVTEIVGSLNSNNRSTSSLTSANGLIELIIETPELKASEQIEITIESKNNQKNIRYIITNSLIDISNNLDQLKIPIKSIQVELNNQFNLHLFIDHSILEFFINYDFSICSRIYDFREEIDIVIKTNSFLKYRCYILKPISIF